MAERFISDLLPIGALGGVMMEVCSDLCCEVDTCLVSSQLLKMNGSSLTKTVIRTKIIHYQ